jgi:TolB-like protein
MKRTDAGLANDAAAEAAGRFVRADAGDSAAGEAELARWLAAHPDNERAMERVELAVELGRKLTAEPGSALYAEAQLATRPLPRPRRVPFVRTLAWGSALAALLLIALRVGRVDTELPAEPVVIRAARAVAVDAPNSAAAMLPGGVVVDASSVAVLPFAGASNAVLAAGLERDLAEALRTVPGLYVIADAAVQPYAGTELGAAELGGLLGARGLVDGSVELVEGRLRVSARLREAATGMTLWQAELDRPVDELRAVRYEIADEVATAMFDSRARAAVAAVPERDGAPSSAKPFQQ